MQQNLKQLKRNSIHARTGMPVRWPNQKRPGSLDVNKIVRGKESEHKFAQNNGIIAYVCDGKLYVTPYTHDAVLTLEEAGFVRTSNLYVPFSNGDLPQEGALNKWEHLIRRAHQANQAAIDFGAATA